MPAKMPTVKPSKHPPSLFPPLPSRLSTVPSPPPCDPPSSFFPVAVADAALPAIVVVWMTLSEVGDARRSVGWATSVASDARLLSKEEGIGEEDSSQYTCRVVMEAEAAGQLEATQVRRGER